MNVYIITDLSYTVTINTREYVTHKNYPLKLVNDLGMLIIYYYAVKSCRYSNLIVPERDSSARALVRIISLPYNWQMACDLEWWLGELLGETRSVWLLHPSTHMS